MWWKKTGVNEKGLPLRDQIDWTKATEVKNHPGRSWGVAYWIEGEDIGFFDSLLGPPTFRRHGFEALARHRLDGPAYESGYRTKEWWQYGVRHRSDGPAVIGLGELPGGMHTLESLAREPSDWENPHCWSEQQWIVCGKRHRLDGPAVISRRCRVHEFFINNEIVEPSAIYDDEEEIEAHFKMRQNARFGQASLYGRENEQGELIQGLPPAMAKLPVPLNRFT
jgi:hypothetical protein